MFKEFADLYDAIYNYKTYVSEAAQIADVVREACPKARTLLDVGCGTGAHARYLATRHGFKMDRLNLNEGLLEGTQRALECFRRHLAEGGVVLVEPWFAPGVLEDGRISRQSVTHLGRELERTARTEIDGRISRLWFDYRIETAEGVRHVSEVHELGLFTADEMAAAFAGAGLQAEFDPVGLTGRGLWVARAGA